MKITILMGLSLMVGVAFANDGYLFVGHGKAVEKGREAPIALALSDARKAKDGAVVPAEAVAFTNAAAVKACAGKSYEAVFLMPKTVKKQIDYYLDMDDVVAMKEFLKTVKTKSVVAINPGGAFENFVELKKAFAGIGTVTTIRDDLGPHGWEWPASWASSTPGAAKRFLKAADYAADPAKRDGLHPLPAKITVEGTEMVLDFESPALNGQSLVLGDTLYHKFYVCSKGRTNWQHVEAYVEGNKVHLDCAKIKEPYGVRLAWWHLSPFRSNEAITPGFVLAVTE